MIVDIIFVVLVVILILAIYKLKFKSDTAKIANTNINQIPTNGTTQTHARQNAEHRIQHQNRPRWAQQPTTEQEKQQNVEQSDDQNQPNSITDRKKQLRKQQKAKLRQQRKEALEHHLEQQKQKREKQQQQELQKQKIEEQKRRKEEEYYRMLAEQQEKRKKAEYDKWKGMFKVETQGKSKQSAQIQQQKKESLLKSLLQILQKKKLSLLEDLAHKFKLTTKQLIEKIKQLQSRGDVKGIFDERGKYLVIEVKQWEAIRNYIEARGRIKKTDIMQQCARIIKIPDDAQIDEEALSLIQKQNQNQS